MPFVCRRYTLTNRRIIIRRGLRTIDGPWISLDEFESIRIEILPGQKWLRAGDLVFLRGGVQVLRLPGVSHPEAFRQICLTAQTALIDVRKILTQQAAGAA
jgi:hypothetical protein